MLLIYDNALAWPLAPALPMMPAKARAQEDTLKVLCLVLVISDNA
jgi:hypothetical protein